MSTVHNNVPAAVNPAAAPVEAAAAATTDARVTNVAAQALQAPAAPAIPVATLEVHPFAAAFDPSERIAARRLPVAVRITEQGTSASTRRRQNTDIHIGPEGNNRVTRRRAGIAASADGVHIYRTGGLTGGMQNALVRRDAHAEDRAERSPFQVFKDALRSPTERARVNRVRAHRRSLRTTALALPNNNACRAFLIGKAYHGQIGSVRRDGDGIVNTGMEITVVKRDTDEGHAAAHLVNKILADDIFSTSTIRRYVEHQAMQDDHEMRR
ncbi:hypothetical protein COB21_04805 [Candidatus Aerophobetes bacterium]|uniref:Uncharacterized protein n=1 Tax=Aerophobetes bacterium TaxID=2030807 RepID=A0A2A4X242_UNCAE|nr:MAG: hypothetical protein COB21_04805 [Candidatus Aerophobetes bacterium]